MRLFGIFAIFSASVFGSITYVGSPGPDVSNALYASNGILDLGGNSSSESGCVAIVAGGSDIEGSCTLGPISPVFSGADTNTQSQTRTGTQIGIVDGNDLRIVFDANEGGGLDQAITLNALRLIVQNPTTGALIFFADLDTPTILLNTNSGAGKSDAIFKLDALQASAFDAAIAGSGITLGNAKFGLYANLINANSGPETFYIGNIATFDPGGTPEPSTYIMVGTGLLATALIRRRRT